MKAVSTSLLLTALLTSFSGICDTLQIRQEPILPIPDKLELNTAKVELGKILFHEPKLSRKGDMSCASCHFMDKSGDDNRKVTINNDGTDGTLNTPTMFNVAFNHHVTWTGKFTHLEPQIYAAFTNPKHMAADWKQAENLLQSTPSYKNQFNKIYGDGITVNNFIDAIAEYEHSLITPNSPFDQWLLGNDNAISTKALDGYKLFKEIGCITCHQGRNIGGNIFQPLGLFKPHHEFQRRAATQTDMGRFNVTQREQDKYVFRVAPLRNVAVTGPWFHDGSEETLKDAIQSMAEYQLGIQLEEHEVEQIEAFLETLTGEYQGKVVVD